jgi:hypothetical protein
MIFRSFCFGNVIALFTIVFGYQAISAQTITDIDGNSYPVIQAGSYLWMAENLRVAHDLRGYGLDYFRMACESSHSRVRHIC